MHNREIKRRFRPEMFLKTFKTSGIQFYDNDSFNRNDVASINHLCESFLATVRDVAIAIVSRVRWHVHLRLGIILFLPSCI